MSGDINRGSPVSADVQARLAYDAGRKSIFLSYVLWFFLGGLGLHRFYLQRTGSAVILILLTIFSVATALAYIGLVGLVIVGIWLLVDLFLIPGMVNSWNNNLVNRVTGASLD